MRQNSSDRPSFSDAIGDAERAMAQKTMELQKARVELRKLESRILVPPPAEWQAGETNKPF